MGGSSLSCTETPVLPTPTAQNVPVVSESFVGSIPVAGEAFYSFSTSQYGNVMLTLLDFKEAGTSTGVQVSVGIGQPARHDVHPGAGRQCQYVRDTAAEHSARGWRLLRAHRRSGQHDGDRHVCHHHRASPMRSARLFLLFAALLAAGCGDDEPPTQPSGSGGSPLQELYSEILSPGGATFYAFQSAYAGAARVTLINVTDASGAILTTPLKLVFGVPQGTGCGPIDDGRCHAGVSFPTPRRASRRAPTA